MTRFLPLLAASMLIASAAAQASSTRVENFVLLDHKGDAHELYYHDDATAIVLVAQANACAASVDAAKTAQALAASDVRVFLLNPSLEDNRAAIAELMTASAIEAPVLQDETQLIAEALNMTTAGEVLLIDPSTWQIRYRGDAASAGKALAAMREGGAMPPAQAVAGCEIAFPHADKTAHAQISYADTIAPLLQEKCVVCHTEGGLGPWAMTDYNMIRGFAPMIREVVRTKRMPPWHADPHVGVWKNDISLTNEQTQALVHWVEAGAPRGDGPDPLLAANVKAVAWQLGEPDMIIDIPAYEVPASGVVDYQFPTVENPLDEGVWIRAAAAIPGDREVVHHILAGTIDADASEERRDSGVFDNYLIGYAPGNESHEFPEGTGVYVPPGGSFLFQMHYTPVGRVAVDASKLGLYFHDKKPGNFYRQQVVVDPTIRIPPNEARHAETAYYQFDKPVMLHDLIPHSHYRGVASRFELIKPDGSRETVLNVPNYDFNWQRTYEFVEPRRLEPGTKLVHTTWYDNSAANKRNPDPEREVPWGLQSWDEMLYGGFSYTYVDETTESPIHDPLWERATQTVGVFDDNFDGKLSWREMPKELKKRLVQGFKAVDKNGDGGLDIEEWHALTVKRAEAAAASNAGAR